jgi:hypothetical protein
LYAVLHSSRGLVCSDILFNNISLPFLNNGVNSPAGLGVPIVIGVISHGAGHRAPSIVPAACSTPPFINHLAKDHTFCQNVCSGAHAILANDGLVGTGEDADCFAI